MYSVQSIISTLTPSILCTFREAAGEGVEKTEDAKDAVPVVKEPEANAASQDKAPETKSA